MGLAAFLPGGSFFEDFGVLSTREECVDEAVPFGGPRACEEPLVITSVVCRMFRWKGGGCYLVFLSSVKVSRDFLTATAGPMKMTRSFASIFVTPLGTTNLLFLMIAAIRQSS